jgi:hypothetical protein
MRLSFAGLLFLLVPCMLSGAVEAKGTQARKACPSVSGSHARLNHCQPRAVQRKQAPRRTWARLPHAKRAAHVRRHIAVTGTIRPDFVVRRPVLGHGSSDGWINPATGFASYGRSGDNQEGARGQSAGGQAGHQPSGGFGGGGNNAPPGTGGPAQYDGAPRQ